MDERTAHELLAKWLAGTLAPDGAARLLTLLREQPALLNEAARLKSFDRLLRASQLEGSADTFVREVAARCGVEDVAGKFVGAVQRRLRWRKWTTLAAAACLMFGAALWNWWLAQPVATVESLQSVRWADGQRALLHNEELRRGRIAFADGFVALRFRHGARLLVEGPAELDLRSPDRVRIFSGSAVAHVPEPAIGFTVEGPTGRVVDKGTAFGVTVGKDNMEVHVLEGLVEAGRGAKLQPLREREALQISSLDVKSITADPDRFLTALPPTANRPVGWVRWSFDEGEGDAVRAAGTGFGGTETSGRLRSLVGGMAGPQWTNGQFGSALAFDGKDDYVQTDFPGIGGSAPRTVAFWVKVPRDFQITQGYALVCWGNKEPEGEGWQISVNPKAEAGEIGRLRVGRIGEPIIGATDLRDDRWHHIAVVFYGGESFESSTQILIYVDGELERTPRKGVPNVRTATASPEARKVAFGLNIGPVNKGNPKLSPNWRVFRGSLDEVFICDAALSQEQVRDLMARNHTAAFAPELLP